ncbi:MAG: hypothetical protein ACN4E2_01180 [Nitrospinota bacterium]
MDVKREKLEQQINTIYRTTHIERRELEIALDRFNMVIYGKSSKSDQAVARVVKAEGSPIKGGGSVYLATLADGSVVESKNQVTLGYLTNYECEEELTDLVIQDLEPIRNLTVVDQFARKSFKMLQKEVFDRFEDKNIAIIHTEDEMLWSIAALRYIHELDIVFPDPFVNSIFRQSNNKKLAYINNNGRFNN